MSYQNVIVRGGPGFGVLGFWGSESARKGLRRAFEPSNCRVAARLKGCCLRGRQCTHLIDGTALMLASRVAAFEKRSVREGRSVLPHFTKDKVALDFLRGIITSEIGGIVVIEGDLDPVVSTLVDTALLQCISSKTPSSDPGIQA